jgi:hypothetical protein
MWAVQNGIGTIIPKYGTDMINYRHYGILCICAISLFDDLGGLGV